MKYEKYNGWTNYETWNAALWLDNDEGSQNLCIEFAQECYDNADEPSEPFTREEQAASDLSDRLKDLFEQDTESQPTSGWMADAIGSYLSEVNFYEIAQHYIEDNVEKAEDNA